MEVVEGQQPLVADYEIVGAIRTELFADEQVGRRGIGINSRRGVVTLSGTVHDAAAKRRAVERARSVPGVRAVIDRLEVGKPDLIELDRDEVAEAAPREAAP